jgi:hypothetical protein
MEGSLFQSPPYFVRTGFVKQFAENIKRLNLEKVIDLL